MVRHFLIAALIGANAIAAGPSANAEEARALAQANPNAKPFSTTDTDIGTLLDNPAAKAVLDKHIPQFTANTQIEMARPMTLKQIQSYASDMLTDGALAKIDADLAKLPARN